MDSAADIVTVSRRRRVLRDDTIRAAQQRHFVLFDILPAAAAVAAVPLLWHIGLTAVGVALFAGMWIVNLVGIEVGYHRLFSHGAFTATPGLRAALVILGSMGAQGPVISWASNHRHHHQHADTPEDTHTPHAGYSFAHAHLLWKWSYPYPSPSHYTPNLLRDRTVLRTSRHYTLWILLGLALPALLGGALFIERVFTWPGMGLMTVNAIASRDYPLVTASVVVGGMMVAAGSLVADLLLLAVDPRVRTR